MEMKIRINVTLGWEGWVGTFWGAKNILDLDLMMATWVYKYVKSL